MYKSKTIGVIVPLFNEANLILKVLDNIPEYIDNIFIVNDGSTDDSRKIIEEFKDKYDNKNRFELINNDRNRGLGFSLEKGYERAFEEGIDVTAVMAGDNQMDPANLPSLIEPILEGDADYTKGNRLTHDDFLKMPRFRRYGNSIITLLTKIVTGYWHIVDPQNGYTAANRNAVSSILKGKIASGYGYNCDFLVSLNKNNLKVKDVKMSPVYATEKSGIKIGRYTIRTSLILFTGFFRRIHYKYGGYNFHPLLLFYYFGIIFGMISIIEAIKMFRFVYEGGAYPEITLMVTMFCFVASSIFLLFAFLLDMERSK